MMEQAQTDKERVEAALKTVCSQEHYRVHFDHILLKIKQQFEEALSSESVLYWNKFKSLKREFTNEKEMLINYQRKMESSKSILKHQINHIIETIQERQSYNRGILDKFRFKYQFPTNTTQINLALVEKEKVVLQAELQALKELIFDVSIKDRKALLEKLSESSEYYRKTFKEIKELKTNLNKHLQSESTNFSNLLVELLKSPSYESIHVKINSRSGKLSINDFKTLSTAITQQLKLKSLVLYFMDNEFDQNKCEVLKDMVKERVLEKIKFHNYYVECKMGVFVDFNWGTVLRKAIHIFAGKW